MLAERPTSHGKRMTILHVEDEPALVLLIRLTFERFGFRGDVLPAGRVAEAVSLLTERGLNKEPLDLILTDMQLPDGTGLEVLRQVKGSPVWHRTPVIVLSGETSPGLINEAYALGANCFLPKLPNGKGAMGSIQALYQCWVEAAFVPQPAFADRAREVMARGVALRARTAQFYLGLARACTADPEEEEFWLGRALVEGNLSNLLAFFEGQISDSDLPAGLAERAAAMQHGVERTLDQVETFLQMRSSSGPEEICGQVLDLVEGWDEEIFAQIFGALCPKSPAVTAALSARAVCHLRELGNHVLQKTPDPELCRRAEDLLAFADRLAEVVCPAGGTMTD